MSSAPVPLAAHRAVMWLRPAVRVILALAALLILGLLLARAPLPLVTLLVAGATGAILVLRNPALGLYALAIAIPFGSLAAISIAGGRMGPAQPLLAMILIFVAARSLAYRQIPSLRSPLLVPLGALLGALACSLLNARALGPAIMEYLKWIEFALLLVFVGSFTDRAQRRWLLVALLVAGLVEAALGIYQFVRQVGPPGFILLGRYMRAHGTFGQPNPYGGYLGLLLPVAYSIVITRWPGKTDGTRGTSLERLLWVLAVAATGAMSAALVMSWSRGALLGLVAGVALVLFALARRVWPLLIFMVLGLLLLAPLWQPLIPGDYLSRLDDTTAYLGQDLSLVEIDDANFAVIERLAHWEAAWRMFSVDPWLGVGVGQYAVVYPSVALARWQDPLGHAHNYYLNMLAESGILGLLAYGWFLLSALRLAWGHARHGHGWERTLALGALGMLGHLITHSLVDNLYVQEMYLLVAMILGMLHSRDASSHVQVTPVRGSEGP